MFCVHQPIPDPQDYELVDNWFPQREASYEDLLIRETRATGVMRARLELEAKLWHPLSLKRAG
jgi:hypothetical protein